MVGRRYGEREADTALLVDRRISDRRNVFSDGVARGMLRVSS